MTRSPKTSDNDPFPYGPEYAYFCKKVTELSGIKLDNYKSQQMHRRLVNYMNRNQIPDFLTFARRIQRDQNELDKFLDYLTINVSEFFRNKDQWKALKNDIIPQLTQSAPIGKNINIWSAGASGGQEAYSLAMLFLEMNLHRVCVLGTDIDEKSLTKAREGRYSEDEVKGVPEDLLAKYFDHDGQWYRVSNKVKRLVRFEKHNLLGKKYPKDMDLILCRNVLIYFTDEGKQHVVSNLVDSLRPGGVLMIGATEALFDARNYGLSQIRPFFYKRCF